MYENEFSKALQAIAESVNEDEFNSIVEGAAILIEENDGMSMDEAVQASAAMLYNEDAIGDGAFAVTDAVIDEFVSNIPATWEQTMAVIAESVDEETFNALMNEALGDAAKKVGSAIAAGAKKAGGAVKSYAADPFGSKNREKAKTLSTLASKTYAEGDNMKRDTTRSGEDKARMVTALMQHGANLDAQAKKERRTGNAKAIGTGVALVGAGALGTVAAKKAIDAAKQKKALKAAEEAKLSNKVKAKLEEGKEKAGELADAAKKKLAPKNEDASSFISLKDLRALAEAAQTAEEQ